MRLRVLIQGYNTCCQNVSGGVQIRIKSFVEALKKTACEVELFCPFSSDLRSFDILHVFKLDIENITLIRTAKSLGKKVVLSPILNTINGKRIDFYFLLRKLPIATTYRILFEIIELSDMFVVETEMEKRFLIRHFKAKESKILVVGNGARDYSTTSKKIFDIIGNDKKYVLQVGRFDENKNQLRVIQALKETNINVVFIGGPDINNTLYYDKCIAEAEGYRNIYFLGWIKNSDPLLASAYANAKVIVCASFSETFGLTIIEGAIAGALPVLSKKLAILEDEHFKDCITFDPSNNESIRNSIITGMNITNDERFSEKIKSDFSWDNIAKMHIELYMKMLR